MKMTLRICGLTVQDIKQTLRILSEERLHSNCTDCSTFDYDFVDSNDLWKYTGNLPCIEPEEGV